MTHELYHRYRPSSLKEVIGQPEAVQMLSDMFRNGGLPHTVLLTGPSGTGKTTLARIIKRKLECSDTDFKEVNCAISASIEMVRDIRQRMTLKPMQGKCRIWLLDECQSLSRVSFAQQALLKILEDTPEHVYFILATTDPTKLISTIKNRCTEIKLKSLSAKMLRTLLDKVVSKEEKEFSDEVLDRIVEVAEGSARKALVLLHQIADIESEEEQLNAIMSSDSRRQAIDIAKALMNPRVKWAEIAKLLKEVDEEPEAIRRLILGYAHSVLLGGGKMAPRAYLIIQAFRDHVFDSGKAGLAANAYEVVSNRT